MHLLVKCKHVQKIWKALAHWLDYFCFIKVEFAPAEIVFNDYNEAFPDLVNTICLITKYYIYVQKMLSQNAKFP